MTDLLDDLTGVLTAEAVELRALVPLLDEQQAALTRADCGRVTAAMFGQEPILRRLLRLDQRRRVLVSALGARCGLDGARVSLSGLVERAPTVPAGLALVQADLRRLLEAVDVRNRRNAFLVARAATCIEGLVRAVMTPAVELAPAYVASGRVGRRRPPARLVDRSA